MISSVVQKLICKSGAIFVIAPLFVMYAGLSSAQNGSYQNGNNAVTSSQSDFLLEIQALRKEVAELRNLIDMQAYQLQQVQQKTGVVVTPQQEEVPQRYNQFPGAPPSASEAAYNDPEQFNQQNSLPVVDEVQIGGSGTNNTPQSNNIPQGEADFTQAPTLYQEDNGSVGDNSVATQPPFGADAAAVLPRPNVSTSLSEGVLYQQAFANLKEANHKKAVEQFKVQLQTYPNGEYADDALYWIGESSYVNRNLAESKKHFQLLAEQYTGSHRVPDAWLKIAMIEKEQGNKSKARELFKRVINQHPKSNAAISARNSLAHL